MKIEYFDKSFREIDDQSDGGGGVGEILACDNFLFYGRLPVQECFFFLVQPFVRIFFFLKK